MFRLLNLQPKYQGVRWRNQLRIMSASKYSKQKQQECNSAATHRGGRSVPRKVSWLMSGRMVA